MNPGLSGCSVMFLVILMLHGALFASPQSQQPAASTPAPTFKSSTHLVLVPTIVRNKDGQHIGGLKTEDFIVREDGKPVKVEVFEEVIASPKYTKPEPSKLPPGTFTNEPENRAPKALVVLALDTINTAFADKVYARQQLFKYLQESLDDDKMVALVEMKRSGVRIIHDFTTDPKVLIEALRRIQLGPAEAPDPVELVAEDEERREVYRQMAGLSILGTGEESPLTDPNAFRSQVRNSVLQTLDCLKQIAQVYGGISGRKALVWVSGGFPFSLTNTAEMQLPDRQVVSEGLVNISADYDRTWKVLNNANFSIYPVDARGLVNTYFWRPVEQAEFSRTLVTQRLRTNLALVMQPESISTFRSFANMTGGRAFVNNNDLTRGFRAAVDDTSAYYLIGYYSAQKKPGWHRLKVQVRQKNANVRARSGYLVAKDVLPAQEAELRKMDVSLALHSPMQFSAVSLRLRLVTASPSEVAMPGKKPVAFELDIPVDTLDKNGSEQVVSLSLVGVAQDKSGNVIANVANEVNSKLSPGQGGLNFRHKFDLPPGQHTLRVVVHDNFSGRTGSVIAPVTVE